MMIALFTVLVIVAVGGRATDAVRLSQAESILARLPEAEARAYYDILRRRVRRTLDHARASCWSRCSVSSGRSASGYTGGS